MRIKAGEVTLAFRRWRRPTVKAGGRLRTAIGELSINSVDRIGQRSITTKDARRAGFDSKAELLAELAEREGDLYRIDFAFAGPDTRIALRKKSAIGKDELANLLARLARLDAHGGPWTRKVLRLIEEHPEVVSTKLAAKLSVERDWLKPNIRKLKNMGLTVSHKVGYSLSPRGRRVLKAMEKR